MEVVQNADTAFMQSPDFLPGLLHTQSFRIFLGIKFFVTAVTFSSLHSHQTVLFPQRIDENIAATDRSGIVNAVIDNLNLESFAAL